jgi:hypothetical protein
MFAADALSRWKKVPLVYVNGWFSGDFPYGISGA